MKTTIQAAAAAITLIASSAAHAQEAVQWKVSDGGNGHWYQIVQRNYGTYDWNQTRASCTGVGGDLATFETNSEWIFIRARCQELPTRPVNSGQLLAGGRRAAGGSSQWTWLSGVPFAYFAWSAGTPNDGVGADLVLCVGRGLEGESGFDGWDDWRVVDLSSGYIIEWSADCNSDGIVDYGQILDGTFPDANGNGVPDCCDGGESCTPCPGDVVRDDLVDGVDLAAVLSQWGTQGSGTFNADIDNSGLVDGGDLALVLGGWGPCPQ